MEMCTFKYLTVLNRKTCYSQSITLKYENTMIGSTSNQNKVCSVRS